MIRKIKLIFVIFFIVLSSLMVFIFTNQSNDFYWDKQRKGANIFNEYMTSKIWQDAANANIKIVRLAPDKWHGKKRDFLIGNADDYTELVAEDLNKLKKTLADADKNNIKVVLTMLSLPGDRWKQLNNNRDDSRLWQNENYQEQAIQFWQDLTKALKGNPAIVGYNIINEPHPEVVWGYKNLTTPLSGFYQKIVDAIRNIDPNVPIILDVGMYADPRSFSYFKPIHGENILYAFHMYEPYHYTNKKLNHGQYIYPGKMLDINKHRMVYMNKNKLQATYFQAVIDWQEKYHIPATRIFVEEFGGNRTTKGLDNYFRDLIDIFNKNGWHWAFYSFREDTWDGMDYELGNNSAWKVIQHGLIAKS